MCKKLFMLTSLLLVWGLVCPNAAFGAVVEIPIAAENDDVEEQANGNMSFDSSDLELVYDNDVTNPDDQQVVGMRFLDVPIPKGMAIISATVRFDADDVDDAEHVGDAYVIIEGELSPNTAPFEDMTNNVSERARTAAHVSWGPAHWSEKHAKYHTPEIGGIIQEIVDQDDWASGNALVIIISQDPATASTGVLEAESFKDNATEHIDRRPTLIVEFSEERVPYATDPVPADGAEDVALDAKLSWTPGKSFVMHDLYFGTDEATIAAGSTSALKAKIMQISSYDPGPLAPFMTYYWRVDEFTSTGTVPGSVWSFSTPNYLPISDGTTTLDYDNSIEPYLSEVAFDTPSDLTAGGLATDLSLRFRSVLPAPPSSSFDAATGTYTITSAGIDIWGSADEFCCVYRELTGDGSIMVRVTDNGTGSNAWAKGGVMIRQDLTQGSVNVMGAITGGSGDGGTFQWRDTADSSSSSNRTLTGIAPPYWVYLVRMANTFAVFMSADGVTWEQEGANPVTIEMTDPVLIGLAVTSHQENEPRTFTFDNLSITGNVTGEEKTANVGVPANSAEPVYAVIEDSAGASAMVFHPDPAATQIAEWEQWAVPLSDFAGVDPTAAAKLYVGVGDGQPGGIGTIDIADIRMVEVEPVANLLANGGFEDGVVEPWSTYGAATTEVVQTDPVEGDYCLHVTVSEAGANFWDAGLQHTGHVFEAGKNYALSAWLKCSQGTLDINFKPELGADPWTGYGSQAFTMTEEWAEYSVTTGVFDADVSPATITFHIAYAPGDFYVDGVKFVEIE